ncbi:MAG: hypothetical protein C0392_05365 [Syntrophus sp. (in: bacteria)]|nr:hypothetical protein [Syntrophus sp. (in: bacteria)]
MPDTGKNIRIGILLNVSIGIVFIIAAVIVVVTVNYNMHQQALSEAQSKARIILDRNLATHTYFSKIMKPSIFAWTEPFRTKEYFDHTWMSSTYAIREIEKFFKSFNPSGYAFRDAAIDARSPENEADTYERAFIERLNADKRLESESKVRTIDGKPYLVVLRKGEVMEASCLQCHSTPNAAPKGLTDYYGSKGSFNRKAGDAVSAVSLRIPLAEAYGAANTFSLKLSAILLVVLACIFTVQYWLYRFYLLEPLNVMREKANQIATHEWHLGEQIPEPFGKELGELTTTFNEMSVKLRYDRDHLEELVNERTEVIKKGEDKIKSLLSEKELLLKEVHHRIKNNMTTMMSLLSLQANNQKDPSVTAVLESAGNRLQSMMVLYDKLYRSENLREMPAADYLIPLVNEIIGTFPTKIEITTEITIDDFVLPVNLLSPLGIIMNELITNIMKHAFPPETFATKDAGRRTWDERNRGADGSGHKNVITVSLRASSDPQSVVTDTPPSVIARSNATKQSTSTKQDCHAPPGSLAMTGNDEGSLAMTGNYEGSLAMTESGKGSLAMTGNYEGSLPQDSEPRTLNVEHRTLAKQGALAKQATLIIADNGTGIPDTIDPESSDGFGLYLVRMLARQIDGTMTIEQDKGTRFILAFDV